MGVGIPRILVAGMGNIFLGDDAFGVEVVERLGRYVWPDGVDIVDFGIRSFDLSCALMDPYDAFILISATPHGQTPGTLYSLEIRTQELGEPSEEPLEGRSLNPIRVLQIVQAAGIHLKDVTLVACEPEPLSEDEQVSGRVGLSPRALSAVEDAVRLVQSLVESRAGRIAAGIYDKAPTEAIRHASERDTRQVA